MLNHRKQAASALLFGMVALVTKPGQTFAPLLGTWLLCFYTGEGPGAGMVLEAPGSTAYLVYQLMGLDLGPSEAENDNEPRQSGPGLPLAAPPPTACPCVGRGTGVHSFSSSFIHPANIYGIPSLSGAILGASRERDNKIRQIRSLPSWSLYSVVGWGGVSTIQLNKRKAGRNKCTGKSTTVKKLLCEVWKDPEEMAPRM